jgi:hypothetical protein
VFFGVDSWEERRVGGMEFEMFVHYRFFSSPSENGEREGH